ncbi:MAG: HPF/RaiA family ribosome-associated protein [bacterium]|nr:HPF/RaiA family ribosome-associated protein [bacterium]
MIRKTLKATSFLLTAGIEQAVDRIVESLETYVDPDDTSALAEIEVSRTTRHHRGGEIFRAEINFHSRRGNLRVESEKEDLYIALGAAKDELLEALRSRKLKRIHFIRRSGLALKNMLRGLPWRRRK